MVARVVPWQHGAMATCSVPEMFACLLPNALA